ncbi:hypothetical protein LD85_2489 [Saccharolobus islandicus L.D.8.5]|uniref:Uncharacterized protein n=1 Tax=Saccharolobus islandicus (strain L.D.8.5 / Lassen \|nr:hypothetical protein LD85_2489 [Sulfolobus islandicus L.D.8.5]
MKSTHVPLLALGGFMAITGIYGLQSWGVKGAKSLASLR